MTDETRTVRQTIQHHLPDFLNNYQCQKETIPGLQSNLFLYEGSKLHTCYLNNIQTGLSRHLKQSTLSYVSKIFGDNY